MKLAILAVAALLAQGADSQPVVGGGSFNAAPILEPGRYRDTILPGEYLYYGFRLRAGQSLHVTATTSLPDQELNDLGVQFIAGNIQSPTRTLRSASNNPSDHFWIPNDDGVPLQLTGAEVEGGDDTATSGPWTGAGVYYLALNAINDDDKPRRAEIPIEFEVEVNGTAQPQVTPTATPTPTPRATPAPGPADEASGPGPGVAAAFGIGGLLLGVIAGIARRQRRR